MDAMVEQLYHELRRLAAGRLKRYAPGHHTLQPTALVHEIYLRMGRNPNRQWQDRRHFYYAAAQAMRHLLIERARSRMAVRHGGEWVRTDLDEFEAHDGNPWVLSNEELLSLDRALTKLQSEFPKLVELVLLRYFCGLTVAEIAKLDGKATRTVERNWAFARAWLIAELEDNTI